MRILKYFVTVLILCLPLSAQGVNLGFRIEPTFFFTEEYKGKQTTFSPYSLSFVALIDPFEDFRLEMRTGFFLGGEEFTGYDVGGFLRYELFKSNFYSSIGLLNNANSESGGNNRGTYAKNILFYGIGLGLQHDNLFGIDIMYFWTNDNVYGYSIISDYISSSQKVDKTINGMIRIGFNFAFNIIQF